VNSVYICKNGDVLRSTVDMIEVTSLSRPDEHWRFKDAAGHEHSWFAGGKPATFYQAIMAYDLPTLLRVEDTPGDDEYPATGHYECRECHEHVQPGTAADSFQQFIPGLRRFYINDRSVSWERMQERVAQERAL
jgi:hypothetical protein